SVSAPPQIYSRSLSRALSVSILSSLRPHRILLSFPTRRSSDLIAELICIHSLSLRWRQGYGSAMMAHVLAEMGAAGFREAVLWRSEEHTSELQSRFDLVCRLLLEKK